jgi:hypothetical protein
MATAAREAGDATRLAAVESRLDEIASGLTALRVALGQEAEPPPRAQERLAVSEAVAGPQGQ